MRFHGLFPYVIDGCCNPHSTQAGKKYKFYFLLYFFPTRNHLYFYPLPTYLYFFPPQLPIFSTPNLPIFLPS